MTVEFRPVTAEEIDEFKAMPSYVFANPGMVDQASVMRPDWTSCAFVDGRLATTFAAFPFRVRLNGRSTRMAGVTMVGTYPQYRRQGLLRQIMVESFAQQRERGQAIAILWASMAAIYQRFGYGLATEKLSYSIDPRRGALSEEREPVQPIDMGRFEQLREVLVEIYGRFSEPRNVMIERAPALWDALVGGNSDPVYAAVTRDGGGTPVGYVLYRTSVDTALPIGPNQVLQVLDLVAADVASVRSLWAFLRAHDLVSRITWANAAPEDQLQQLLAEPRELNRTVSDAVWMRITDAKVALGQRRYSEAGTLTMTIVDRDCDWNMGTFSLETDGEETHVGETTTEPDITLDAAALACLVAGSRSATALSRAGRAVGANNAVLARADRLFAPDYLPWCPNNF